MLKLFNDGGILDMSILTIELVLLLLAAWKKPSWVKEIGLIALMTGILGFLWGMYGGFDAIQKAGDISPSVLAGGLKVALIPIIYACLIYFLSLIIRIIRKPKI